MIRAYKSRDLDGVLSCWEASAIPSHPFFTDSFIAKQRDEIPSLYLPNVKTWVDERGSHVAGFLALNGSEVAALFVHPDYQGQGVGRGLLDHIKSRQPRLTLEVFEANLRARAFYCAYGFYQTGTRIHEDVGEPLLCLTLDAA
jgi:putative acetyltransferase